MPQVHPVNLPATLGGFSFKGVHSFTFGVRQTPGDRILLPMRRRGVFRIPGRSTSVIQEDGTYETRVESIECSYALQEGQNVQDQVRKIAQWLQGEGDLIYDYEPNIRYHAYVSNAPPTVKDLEYATFDLEFTCNPPFAMGTEIRVSVPCSVNSSNRTIVSAGDYFLIPETITTPVKIVAANCINNAYQCRITHTSPDDVYTDMYFDLRPEMISHMADFVYDSATQEIYFLEESGNKYNIINRATTEVKFFDCSTGYNTFRFYIYYTDEKADPWPPTLDIYYSPRYL